MAYYSGQASSYQELLNVLVNACVEQGWTWADGILSKDNLYIKLVSALGDSGGITATGGTGKSGNSLVNESNTKPRLGRVCSSAPPIVFPLNYSLHILNNPDEIYLIINFSIDCYHYLAFGSSSIGSLNSNGSGLWIVATAGKNYTDLPYRNAWWINPTVGLEDPGGGSSIASGPFWGTNSNIVESVGKNIIHSGLDSPSGWVGSIINANAVLANSPLIAGQPSTYNQEAIFIPIRVYQSRPSQKISLIADLKHARYLRIDNFQPDQIITLGVDKWKIYPFYKKDTHSAMEGLQ